MNSTETVQKWFLGTF